MSFLGVDIGTSSSKGVLVDASGPLQLDRQASRTMEWETAVNR
ncbi:hypothetical protein OU415_09795 [Saccharopolyspora sp. WRP15-2]|uniref:Carbohydrate kinase FGGY N-terminal domain-containing protein n=1 Tax=Saccharopolyspora oryzae TaxID=2997343 RepID=A0ABT4UVL8_9PSEU|nr:hypothetical protein [Saccharopolyspora oryzae]MDA3625729.1 hypothetical protein [Saccharopolyspora oryzae]